MRMCITGRELVLISPMSPRFTWLEKPGRKTRCEISRENGGLGGARQDEEQPGGQQQDTQRDSVESMPRRG